MAEERTLQEVKPILALLRRFGLFLAIMLVVELILSPFLPSIVPTSWALRLYMRRPAFMYAESLLNGERPIVIDDVKGWRNRDEGLRRWPTSGEDAPTRVALFGNSCILGYRSGAGDKSIDAHLERGGFEALNLACVFYRLDQSCVAMVESVERLRPDVVVMGIGSLVGMGLDRHCFALTFPYEHVGDGLLLKPRYVVEDDGVLNLRTLPYSDLMRGLPDNDAFVEFLETRDPAYEDLERYLRWQTAPLLNTAMIRGGRARLRLSQLRQLTGWRPPETLENWDMATGIVKKSVQFAKEKNFRLVYVLFATASEAQGESTTNYDTVAAFLKDEGVPFVDTKRVFADCEESPESLFCFDGFHLSAQGNE